MAHRILIASWALLFWAAGPGTAVARQAPTPKHTQANQLLKAGSEKMELGLYVEALEQFKAAYKLVPSPKISYNIALANNYLTRYVQALASFESFVREFKDHSHKYWKAARDLWIPRLKKKIATVAVEVNVAGASITVDGKPAGLSPHTKTIRVQPEPGRLFVIVVTKPRYVHRTLQVKLRPGQRLTQKVTLITEARALAQRKEFQREQAERKRFQVRLRKERARAQRQRRRRQKQLRGAGWTVIGTGLALVLTGCVAGVISLADKRYVEGAERDRLFGELQRRYNRGNTLRQVAWAGIGSGLAIAAASGILLWLGYRRPETARPPTRAGSPAVSVLPVLGPHQAGMTLKLQF